LDGRIVHLGRKEEQDTRKPFETANPPQTPTEIELAKLWSDILDRTNIGRFDNFFETGGDSLLALKLSNRIREHLSQPISMKDIFENPTLLTLAEFLDARVQG
jgi:aryl carrier-like protein